MTVKSSDVLRLAAEFALEEFKDFPVLTALGRNPKAKKSEVLGYAVISGAMTPGINAGHKCIALCLAAAIAEDAGD